MKNLALISLVALSFLFSLPAWAGGNELSYFPLQSLDTLAPASVDTSNDYVPVYDASAQKVKKTLATGSSGSTANASEINQLDASELTFASAQNNAGKIDFRQLSFTSSQLNAAGGVEILDGVTGLKHYGVQVDIYPDAAVTTCTDIKVVDESISGHDGLYKFDIPSGYDGSVVQFSSSGIVSFSSAYMATTASAGVALKNVGSSCAGANNYTVSVRSTLAP